MALACCGTFTLSVATRCVEIDHNENTDKKIGEVSGPPRVSGEAMELGARADHFSLSTLDHVHIPDPACVFDCVAALRAPP
jgi:hypothetical protein